MKKKIIIGTKTHFFGLKKDDLCIATAADLSSLSLPLICLRVKYLLGHEAVYSTVSVSENGDITELSHIPDQYSGNPRLVLKIEDDLRVPLRQVKDGEFVKFEGHICFAFRRGNATDGCPIALAEVTLKPIYDGKEFYYNNDSLVEIVEPTGWRNKK